MKLFFAFIFLILTGQVIFADSQSSRPSYWLHRSITDKPNQVAVQKKKSSIKKAHKEALFFVVSLQGLRFMDGDIQCGGICGKFFDKWGSAFHNLDRWPDGDSPETNYIEHGWIEGATFVSIYMQNSELGMMGEKNIKILSKEYLKAISKATLFAAVWSVEFEIGPISEATIGPDRYNKNGMIDYFVTPIGGAITSTGELIFYRKVMMPMLAHSNKFVRFFGKTSAILTPGRSFANLMRAQKPWQSWER